jgi:hypothetical protein
VLVALLSLCICATLAQGITVLVQVYEKDPNVTTLSGASVFVDDALVGKTEAGGILEFSHPGTNSVSVRVTKLGYDEWTGDIGPNTTTVLVQLLRKSISFVASVHDADTLAPISGAQVVVSGEGAGNTTLTNANGTASFAVRSESVYNVEVQARNYRSQADTVEIGIEGISVQYMLLRDDRFSVMVKDEASGTPVPDARVLVDGVDRGLTDSRGLLTLPLPREKVYMVKVKKEGYQDFNGQQIVRKEDAFISIPLEKAPYSAFVSVYDEDRKPVEGAAVLMDRAMSGMTDQYGRLLLGNLTAGQYQLEVRHPGFVTARQALKVSAQGQEITVTLPFEKVNATIAAMEGSEPVSGAEISLDGRVLGTTGPSGEVPARLRLNITYNITAAKEGFNPAMLSASVNAPNATTITIRMERSTNMMLIGGIIAIAAIIVLAVLFIRRGRSRGRGGRRVRL